MHESKSFNKHPANKTLYHALMESLIVDENAMDQGVADLIKHKKRPHDDDDRDQDPPAGLDQGLKKRKTNNDSAQAEETVFEAEDTDMSLNQGDDLSNNDEQPNVEAAPKQDCWLNDLANAEKPPRSFNDFMSTPIDFSAFAMNRHKISKLTKADLVGPNNPEGNRCPYDLSKPLPLHESRGRLTVPVNFFFKNDLEYLRGGSTDRKYTTSTTKTKAAKYDVEGISHWGPKRQRFYEYLINRVSMQDVYFTMRILSVTSVTVDEWYGYGHLKEIFVRRAYQELYKLMEGDFPRLHLNDIEDMLLLVAQNKLNNFDGNVIVHLAVGLRMYTRRIVIQSRVEDL
ncbi:hypothetical protein Tco_0650013 [Tanacetum coccineum]